MKLATGSSHALSVGCVVRSPNEFSHQSGDVGDCSFAPRVLPNPLQGGAIAWNHCHHLAHKVLEVFRRGHAWSTLLVETPEFRSAVFIRFAQTAVKRIVRLGSHERWIAEQHHEKDYAQRKHVDLITVISTLAYFRCHVRFSTDATVEKSLFHERRRPKVNDLEPTVTIEHDVLRFQIAMAYASPVNELDCL